MMIPNMTFSAKMMTNRNWFKGACAYTSAAAASMHRKLKKVQRLPMKMLAYDLEYFWFVSLNRNCENRSLT